jgi:hypothetical protein
MIQIPRGFFKTAVGTMANALFRVCKNPDEPVVIFNERLGNSQKWLRAIKEVVQSSVLFQVLYEDLLPPGIAQWDVRSTPKWWKWSDDFLQFQRGKAGIPESSVTALGIGAASAGGHWARQGRHPRVERHRARHRRGQRGRALALDHQGRSHLGGCGQQCCRHAARRGLV